MLIRGEPANNKLIGILEKFFNSTLQRDFFYTEQKIISTISTLAICVGQAQHRAHQYHERREIPAKIKQ